MPDFSEWGPQQSGVRLAQMDLANLASQRISDQYNIGQIAMQPDIARQHRAAAELAESRAKLAQQDALIKERLAHIATTGAPTTMGADSNPMWSWADAARDAGDWKLMSTLAEKASLIDYRKAATARQTAAQMESNLKAQSVRLDLMARNAGRATDAESFRKGIIDYEQQTGERTGLVDDTGQLTAPFTPDQPKRIAARALSEKDRLAAQARTARDAALEREFRSRQRNRDFWQNTDNIRKSAEARRKGVTGKADASITPPPKDVKAATDYILTNFPNIVPEEARFKGVELAERARSLIKQNAALNGSDAIREAFDSMRRGGAFAGQRGSGRTPENALPLPEKEGDAITGRWYQTTRGPALWTGSGFQLSPPPGSEFKATDVDEDTEDEISDTEDEEDQ